MPLVVDFFGDERHAGAAPHAHVRLEGGLARGMTADALRRRVRTRCARVASPSASSTAPASRIARNCCAQLARALAAARQRCRDGRRRSRIPLASRRCAATCGIPHPEIARSPGRQTTAGWLAKRTRRRGRQPHQAGAARRSRR